MGAALAIVEAQVPVGFDDWIETCRALVQQRDAIDWQIADHIAAGREQFGQQLAFDLLGEQLGIAPKRLKSAVKVAQTFPPALRAPELSFDVHREIARVEPETRLKVLRDAAAGRWNEKVAHERVENIRIESGAVLLDDDPEHREVVEMIRAWNRMSSPEVREYAWPYFQRAARNGFTSINEEEWDDA
jgi:hypothetical protein